MIYRLRRDLAACFAYGLSITSRSSGLLCIEASRAKVSQSGLKTGGGATAGGARGTIMEVMSISS
jgi:hypothetical protein